MKSLIRFSLLTLGIVSLIPGSLIAQQSVARQWSETQLACIRKYFAKPTVNARHLGHVAIAMYDAWAVYDSVAKPVLLGNTWGEYSCPFNGIPMPADGDLIAAQEEAISYAAYRTLWNRYTIFAPGANLLTIQGYLNDRMASLGYDTGITSTDYSDGDPAKLGNYIAAKLQEFALQDGSNQAANYADAQYQPRNGQLQPALPGNPYMTDPNNWQTLVLAQCIDQQGIPIECPPGTGIPALTHEWSKVQPFALTEDQAVIRQRDGLNWKVYLDPGEPPRLDTTVQTGLDDSFFKWGFVMNIIWHSFHNNNDGVMIDASPRSVGGLNITSDSQLPVTFDNYKAFYNLFEGGVDDPGYEINPSTNAPYEEQMVPRSDFTRVLSQYWADGPNSETPPGHWFKLINEVSDKMDDLNIPKKWMGEGETISDLEWDIKGYLAMGGAIHDAAIACWGAKGFYDSSRPIMAIRWMASRGQSSDPNLPSYHPAGLPLIPGYIELVTEGDSLAGENNENVNKIKIFSWRGPFAATGEDGAGWLLGENWWTYQVHTFVTPPFAGYYSGHSTYSRTGAEVMTMITGDEYFPGGMSEFVANQNQYLTADAGPSQTVKLQWATYRDAADQCSISRIYGGLHPPQDDIPGRKVGLIVGPQAVNKANVFINCNPAHVSIAVATPIITDAHVGSPFNITITFDKAMDQTVTPSLIILNPAAESSLQLTGGSWTDAFNYVAVYNIIDNNVTVNNIVVSAQGAEDLNGVVNAPGVSVPFAIDTQNPLGMVEVTGADNTFNDAAAAQNASVDITLEFSETMDTSSDPVFTFSNSDAAASMVLNNSSSWTSETTFHAIFDFIDNNVEASNVDIEIASAKDANGNNQVAAVLAEVITIDTKAPIAVLGLSAENLSDANTGEILQLTLNFDSPMNTSIEPVVNASGLTMQNNLAQIPGSYNAGGTAYTANFVVLDGNLQASGIIFSSIGGQDLAGNPYEAVLANTALSIDTKNPQVSGVTAGASLLADADAGLPFELSITFDEAMSEVEPEITFGVSIPSLTHDAAASSWQGNTYVAVFNLTDANVEVSNIPVQISGAVDAAGNEQNVTHYAYNLFNVDTRNPEVQNVSVSTEDVNSNSATFAITVSFDEAMNTSVDPVISFNPAASALNLTGASAWDSDYTYIARYDVAVSSLADITGIDITVDDATDAAGNPVTAADFADEFNTIALSISNAEIPGVMMYPNPVISGAEVRLNLPTGMDQGEIAVYDGFGKLVYSRTAVMGGQQLAIETNNWATGMYAVRVISNDKQGSLTLCVIK